MEKGPWFIFFGFIPILIAAWLSSMITACPIGATSCSFNVGPTGFLSDFSTDITTGNIAGLMMLMSAVGVAFLNGGIISVLSWVAGVIMVVLGFGITIQVTALSVGGSFGISDQGARQIMAIGFGLIVYGAVSGYATVLTMIPWGIGIMLELIFLVSFVYGVYDTGRTIL